MGGNAEINMFLFYIYHAEMARNSNKSVEGWVDTKNKLICRVFYCAQTFFIILKHLFRVNMYVGAIFI